jgi:hypothetical protein
VEWQNNMTIEFEHFEKDAYLVATISDTTINLQRAESILDAIDAECQKANCQKVLLNELTLEKRKIASYELRQVSEKLPNVRLAFLCKPQLVDIKAKLLSAFTFTEGYRAKHFTEEAKAIQWLISPGR